MIVRQLPINQSINDFFYHFSEEFKNDLSELIINNNNNINSSKYKIFNKQLIPLTEDELVEISRYGKFLTDEERFEINMLEKLKPSHDEIQKAENTIEILELLSEVL